MTYKRTPKESGKMI